MLIVYLVIASIVCLFGIIGLVISIFEEDTEDVAGAFCVIVAAWLWPILLPLAVLAALIVGVLAVLITVELMEEPKWWPFY